jgi:two-component system sensor kinase Ihk
MGGTGLMRKENDKGKKEALENFCFSGKLISVSMDGRNLVVENECVPVRQSEIPRLFEPFYRLDYARSREQGGNGLGLYIVDTIFSALSIPYTFQAKDNPQRMCFTIYF